MRLILKHDMSWPKTQMTTWVVKNIGSSVKSATTRFRHVYSHYYKRPCCFPGPAWTNLFVWTIDCQTFQVYVFTESVHKFFNFNRQTAMWVREPGKNGLSLFAECYKCEFSLAPLRQRPLSLRIIWPQSKISTSRSLIFLSRYCVYKQAQWKKW